MSRDDGSPACGRVAGAAAAIALLGMVADIVLSMLPGWGPESVPVLAADWLRLLAANPLLGLRNLDLLNVAISVVAIPMYVALTVLHARARPAASLTGLALVLIGTAVFAASNAALPMLELAGRWAGAGTAERATLVAAADALLARGAHGSMGAFPGFFLSELGTIAIAIAMLSGELVGKRTAWAGIGGASALACYTVAMTFGFAPASLSVALAAPGGLLVIAWQSAVAARLLRMQPPPGSEKAPPIRQGFQ